VQLLGGVVLRLLVNTRSFFITSSYTLVLRKSKRSDGTPVFAAKVGPTDFPGDGQVAIQVRPTRHFGLFSLFDDKFYDRTTELSKLQSGLEDHRLLRR
jgi:hypothetical protein